MKETTMQALARISPTDRSLASRWRAGAGPKWPVALAVLAGTLAPAVRSSAAALAAQPAQGAQAADQLPVTRVQLYRSGVGYFERQGQVVGDSSIQITFDEDEINDVIKSLRVLDFGGGSAGSVSYPINLPLERRLASFGLTIGDNPSVAQLFARLRGTPVRVRSTDRALEGKVLSVENRPVAVGSGEGSVTQVPFLNLVTGTGIKSVQVSLIDDFEILDATIAQELGLALEALAGARRDRDKPVRIALNGDGARRVAVSYVHEAPVWKTTYRLVLPESPGNPAIVQGWAVVENPTDQDWRDVRLALVSGRPVSFTMDLYEPLYATRPNLPVPTVAGVLPRIYDLARTVGSLVDVRELNRAQTAAGRRAARADERNERDGFDLQPELGSIPSSAAPAEQRAPQPKLTGDDLVSYAIRTAAQAVERGEVFQFEMPTPVTIERQRSAMIPFLTAPIEAQRVSIYTASEHGEHPARGIRLRNTGTLPLLPGPISVSDGPAYAGDAQIGHISPGDTRLLAYAVDQDLTVERTSKDDTNVTRVKLVRGALVVTRKSESQTTYVFNNRDRAQGRSIIVEHPRTNGWTIADGTPTPEEITPEQYRFRLSADAAGKVELTVKTEQIRSQSASVSDYNDRALVAWQRSGALSQRVLEAVRTVQARQAKIATAERELAVTVERLTSLRAEQTRISQNITSLDRTTDAYKNLVGKLNRQEAEIDELTKLQATQTEALAGSRASLEAYLVELNVE